MKREIAVMLDRFYLILGLVLLVLTILSDVGILFLFPSERNYLIFYVLELIFIGSTVIRIIRRKRKVVEEAEEEE